MADIEKRLLMASPYMYKPLFGRDLLMISFHCETFQPKKFTILLTSLTHSTLQISSLLVKNHANVLFFLILRFLRDLAFQLIKYLTCIHISSLLKLFNIYTHFSSCHPSNCTKGRGEALHVQLLHLPQKFYLSIQPFWIPSQNSEYPRIFRVTGANQNAQKLLSTDLVNTNFG